jgi:hypothetical protein
MGKSSIIARRFASVFAKTLDGIEQYCAHEFNLAPDHTRSLGATVELFRQDSSGGEELHRG